MIGRAVLVTLVMVKVVILLDVVPDGWVTFK